ncbi:hypothetical protein GCM10029964_096210 [Kibdelosporangium lantanae]
MVPAGTSATGSQVSTSPAARIVGALPTGCEAVATVEEVSNAVGKPVQGVKLVSGSADTKIGRTARVDCFYGLGDKTDTTDAPVAVGLASYTDTQSAAKRVAATVEDEKQAGAKATDTKIGPDKGTLLIGRKTATLVATHQATTVVVVAQLSLVPETVATPTLTKIADRALSQH